MKTQKSSLQLDDLPELMQLIQLRLPLDEAVRTSVLSKSWLHAWSTIPFLRFCVQGKVEKLVQVERTLKRYLRDNLPIESFDLDINIENKELASFAEKCIRVLATETCTLKELSVYYTIDGIPSTNLPHEILSCKNLTKIRVVSAWRSHKSFLCMTIHHPVIINCVSLRELYLKRVNISQELLDGILSTCRLLVKIDLIKSFMDLTTIKVTNLPNLHQLSIVTKEDGGYKEFTTLEIKNVPNLCMFNWKWNRRVPFEKNSISLGSSLNYLSLKYTVMDNASLDMIKSVAPSLENLTIDIEHWDNGSFRFTCASIKKLVLLSCPPDLIKVKVEAPNLLNFSLEGFDTMPRLEFPFSTLIEKTEFKLDLREHVGTSFFLNMRESLAISSNCNIHIIDHGKTSVNIDIDDLRKRVKSPPATNVEQLSFEMRNYERKWERSPFLDAFFEICHPNYVKAMQDYWYGFHNHFCKVMLREVLEKKKTAMARWPRYLKDVQIRPHINWETLSNSHKSFLEMPNDHVVVFFKLEWR